LDRAAERYFVSWILPKAVYRQPDLAKLPQSRIQLPGLEPDFSNPAARRPEVPTSPGRPSGRPGVAERQLSPAELEQACRKLVAAACVEILASDSDSASLRFCAPLKRPLRVVRWGLATESAGQAAAPRDIESFSTWSGQHMLRDLGARVESGVFGTLPPEEPAARRPAVLGMNTRNKLLAAARAHWLDVLLVASVDTKVQGLNRRTETTVVMRAIDVASGDELWASQPLKQLNAVLGRQFSDYVIKSLADEFQAGPLPTITAAAAAERASVLAKESAHPLAALVEAHYYQRKSLISPGQAQVVYQAILGDADGRAFGEGDGAARKKILDKWLPKWLE
jgi:hypothetical protein